MKKIYQTELIYNAIKDTIYSELLLSLDIPLLLIEYEPGESISSPLDDFNYFQIVLKGSLSIYFIRDDGSPYSLSTGGANYILGDMELFSTPTANVFVEATQKLLTVAIDINLHRDKLLNNVGYLKLAATSMAAKLEALTKMDASTSSLSQRVLNYMKYKCDNNTIKGIEKAAFNLNCSARQLQRIMNNYEKSGAVCKIGKGSYKLISH